MLDPNWPWKNVSSTFYRSIEPLNRSWNHRLLLDFTLTLFLLLDFNSTQVYCSTITRPKFDTRLSLTQTKSTEKIFTWVRFLAQKILCVYLFITNVYYAVSKYALHLLRFRKTTDHIAAKLNNSEIKLNSASRSFQAVQFRINLMLHSIEAIQICSFCSTFIFSNYY